MMKFKEFKNPRTFSPNKEQELVISHIGDIQLDCNDQISIFENSGFSYDVVCKEWGFYATPSINVRLDSSGMLAAKIQNTAGRIYIVLVKKNAKNEFYKYCEEQEIVAIEWLSSEKEN